MHVKKPLQLFSVTSVLVSLLCQSPVYASTPEKHIKAQTERSESAITLSWNDIGTSYKIYKEGK
jgi:hypothetical protein